MALARSSDGRWMAVDLLGQLWVLPATGGAARLLTPLGEEARNPRFHPDNEKLLYQGYGNGQWDIWELDIESGERRALTNGPYDDREPDYSPSGKEIVFSSDRSGSYQIWRLNLADDGLTQLTFGGGNNAFPSYSTKGTSIAYVTDLGDRSQLNVLDDRGLVSIVHTTRGKLLAPAWRPGDGVIAFTHQVDSQSHLKVLLLGTDPLTKNLTESEDVFGFRPAWINRDEIVYTADGRIWRRRLDPYLRQEIPLFASVTVARPNYPRTLRSLDDPGDQPALGIRTPQVSPDGKSIAFTALGDLWLLESGGRIRQLTDDAFVDIDPAFSPDGRQIAFASDRSGNLQLWSINVEGSGANQLTRGSGDAYGPSFAPDGKAIVFLETRGRNSWGASDLKVLSLSSDTTTTVAPSLFGPTAPVWLSNTKLLTTTLSPFSARFREGANRPIEIDLLSGDIGESSRVTARRAIRIDRGLAVSKDGRHIAFTAADGLFRQSRPDAAMRVSPGGESLSFDETGGLTFQTPGKVETVPLEGVGREWPLGLFWRHRQNPEPYVIQAGRLFDGVRDRYQRHMDIHVHNQRITAVVARGTRPYPDRVVDARDLTVLPGLIDMHAHMNTLTGERLGRTWLAFGVTSVREPGANPYDALERREAWDSGKRLGPRLFFTGPLLEGSRSYYGQSRTITDREQLDWELQRAKILGYDLIKTYVRLPDALQAYAIEQSHKFGLPVSSHEIYPAAAYGADAVEHLGATSRRGFNPKVSATNRSYRDMRDIMATTGMVFTPTLSLLGGMAVLWEENPGLFRDPTYRALYSEPERMAVRALVGFFGQGEALRRRTEPLLATVGDLARSGARVVPGTDGPFVPYGLGLHMELELLVKAGLTPDRVLRMASAEAALALGYGRDLGTVEAGKLADLIIVAGDPLTRIKDLKRITAVVRGGQYVPRTRLLQSPESTGPRPGAR